MGTFFCSWFESWLSPTPTMKTLYYSGDHENETSCFPNPCHLPWHWASVLSCAKEDLAPLPNQTWVHSPNIQQCQHTIYIQHMTCNNWVVGKESIVFTARHPRWGQSRTGSSCSKDPNPLMPFRVGFLKTVWGRGSQDLSSAHAQFWLVDGEVNRVISGIIIINLLVPISLGFPC